MVGSVRLALPVLLMGRLIAAAALSPLVWTDGEALLQNSGWNSSVVRSPYARLPHAARSGEWCSPPCPVRAPVWGEGQNGAGLFLAFKTNAPAIALNATLISEAKEGVNCGVACNTGVDMYAYDTNTTSWRWVATAWPGGGGWKWGGNAISSTMVKTDPALPSRGLTRYRIHLPIYNGLTSAAIGIPAGSTILPDPPPAVHPAPILFYGTSIVNGHVASRPGMIFTHVLSRALRRPVINLGFGGQGTMDPSIGRLIAEMKQLAMVAIDCNWNMKPPEITAAAVALVKQLRGEWSPTKPLLLAEGSDAGAAWINTGIRATQSARRAALKAAFAQLVADNVPNLHYVNGEDLIGKSGEVDLPTAMGTHPTDLGHALIARYYTKALPGILTAAAAAATELPPDPHAAAPHHARRGGGEAPRSPLWTPPPPSTPAGGSPLDGLKKASCGSAQIRWTVARTALHIGGRAQWGNFSRENFFDRFPLRARANVTSEHKSIWGLSKCSAGEFVGFRIVGNVSSLWVNYSVFDKYGMNPSGGKLPIMPAVGRNGVDLYAQTVSSGAWVWAGNIGGVTARTIPTNDICGPVTALTDDDVNTPPNMRPLDTSAATRYILYLPLWRACSDDLAIGIPAADAAAGARLVPESGGIDESKPPIVWYGTSIVHGAASTRAGAGFTNRISRALNRTVLNFGFSGSGHMDLGIGMWLETIDAAAFIIDCNWNMGAAEIGRKAGPIVAQLRARHPTTPVVLAEGTPDGTDWFSSVDTRQRANNAALRQVYETLKADPNLHYVSSADLFGASGPLISPTVRGCHPSDLGSKDVAAFYTQFLPSILGD